MARFNSWVGRVALAYPVSQENPKSSKDSMMVTASLWLLGLRTGHPLNLGHGKAYVLQRVLLLFCLSQFYFAKKKAFLGPLHKNPSILSTFPEYLKASPSPPLPPSFPLFCSACPPLHSLLPTLLFSPLLPLHPEKSILLLVHTVLM